MSEQTIDQTRARIAEERTAFQKNRYQWATTTGPHAIFDILDALALRVGALEDGLRAAAAPADAAAS